MFRLAFLVWLVGSGVVWAQDGGTGLKTAVGVDTVGSFGDNNGYSPTNRIDVREAEFMLSSPADYLFDGTASFAAHFHGSSITTVELHEAYVGSSRLIPRSRFRLGQFFLGVGRLNQFHRHDWPFISAPRVHREFFDAEAVADTGVEYSYLLPVPHFVELTAGLTNGWVFGHAHVLGDPPWVPTHYLRGVTYFDVPLDGGSQIGLNYIGRRANDGTNFVTLGADITAKWREGTFLNFLFQSEIWYRSASPVSRTTNKWFGLYVFPQYHVGSNVYAGLRVDYFSNLTLQDAFGTGIKNFEFNFVPMVSWKPSEFTTFRLAYNIRPEYFDTRYTQTVKFVEAQAVFILGDHPAHDF